MLKFKQFCVENGIQSYDTRAFAYYCYYLDGCKDGFAEAQGKGFVYDAFCEECEDYKKEAKEEWDTSGH